VRRPPRSGHRAKLGTSAQGFSSAQTNRAGVPAHAESIHS
jgi:hypothetical protein